MFHNFKQTQSWLLQVEQARNAWAHPLTGDMLADEAGYALYAMVQLLKTAQRPEADEIEAIRKSVLSIPQVAAPVAVKEVRPTGKGDLPYWWEACVPREGFRDPAHIDESLFAATLGGVFADSARDEYLDPGRFLSQTYFTRNLTQMVRDIVSRMNGGEGPSGHRGTDPVRRREDPRAPHPLPSDQQPRAGVGGTGSQRGSGAIFEFPPKHACSYSTVRRWAPSL